MKKTSKLRKLTLRRELIHVMQPMRPLSIDDLGDKKVVGASEPFCPPTGCPATHAGSQTK
jgi:hypothetical protein